jgi:hypothetical protein
MAKAYGIKSVELLEKYWGTPCELDGNKLGTYRKKGKIKSRSIFYMGIFE